MKGIITNQEDTKFVIKLLRQQEIPMVVRRYDVKEDLIILETSLLKWLRLKFTLFCNIDCKIF